MVFKSIPCSPVPRPVRRPSSGGRILGSGAAAPAGGRRIGTAGLFASFWSQKEGHNGKMPFPRQPAVFPKTNSQQKSPHRAGAGQKHRQKQPCFTSSFPRPDGRAGPRRPACTGCPGHGRTCRSRGGSCRGLPPTADVRGRGGYTLRSRSHGRRAGSR